LATLLVIGVVGYGAMSMMMAGNTPPPNLDVSHTRVSDQGLFRGTITPQLDPIQINQLHSWRLHLETPDGQPLKEAEIAIHGDMPGHGHGLPTTPQVTQEFGNGEYLVEGMKFQMAGWWYVDVAVSSEGRQDTIRFNLVLK
jgi:hypothetical protein